MTGLLALVALAALALAWVFSSGALRGEASREPVIALPGATDGSAGARSVADAGIGQPRAAGRQEYGLAATEAEASRSALSPGLSQGLAQADGSEFVAVLVVTDLETGEPVAGATASKVFFGDESLQAAGGEDAWRASTSDESGRVEVVARVPLSASASMSGEDAHEVRLDIRLEAEGYVEAMAAAVVAVPDQGTGDAPGSTVATRTVALRRSGALVLDVVGAPSTSEGELVLWFDSSARSRRPDLVLEWPVQRRDDDTPAVRVESGTGRGIRVVLEGLTPGSLSVALALRGHPVALQQSLVLLPGERLTETLEVKPGEVASGVVLDLSTRQPVPGVSVQMSPGVSGLTPRIDELPYPAAITDGRGAFSIPGLPLGLVKVKLVTVDGAEHPRNITIVEGNQSRKHQLHVRGPAELKGRVVLPKGVSGSGLQVLVTTADAAPHVTFKNGQLTVGGDFGPGVFADVDESSGEFRASAVPSGRKLVVQAVAAETSRGMAAVPKLKLGELREGVELALSPRLERRFRVSSTTGEVIESVDVSFLGPWSGAPSGRDGSSGRKSPSRWTRRTAVEVGADGLFVASPSVAEIERIRIWWGNRARDGFAWPEGGVDEIPGFELEPDPVVAFEVRGSDGLAIRRARIRATLVASDPRKGSARGSSTSSRTDSFGRALLPLPPVGDDPAGAQFQVRVSADGFVTHRDLVISQEDALPSRPQEVVLDRPERIEWGRITGRLIRPNGAAIPAPRFDGLRGGTAHFDEQSFELRGLRPGSYRLVAHCDRFESVALPPVSLRPGERLDVGEIVMRFATRLDVVVKDSKGAPARNALVQLRRLPPSQGGREGLPRKLVIPKTDLPVGRFRRANVPRAKWRLVVSQRGHHTHSSIVTVSGAAKTLNVKLKSNP